MVRPAASPSMPNLTHVRKWLRTRQTRRREVPARPRGASLEGTGKPGVRIDRSRAPRQCGRAGHGVEVGNTQRARRRDFRRRMASLAADPHGAKRSRRVSNGHADRPRSDVAEARRPGCATGYGGARGSPGAEGPPGTRDGRLGSTHARGLGGGRGVPHGLVRVVGSKSSPVKVVPWTEKQQIARPTTPESYDAIVTSLNDEDTAEDRHTRHPPEATSSSPARGAARRASSCIALRGSSAARGSRSREILVVCYTRANALELRRRLFRAGWSTTLVSSPSRPSTPSRSTWSGSIGSRRMAT